MNNASSEVDIDNQSVKGVMVA